MRSLVGMLPLGLDNMLALCNLEVLTQFIPHKGI